MAIFFQKYKNISFFNNLLNINRAVIRYFAKFIMQFTEIEKFGMKFSV